MNHSEDPTANFHRPNHAHPTIMYLSVTNSKLLLHSSTHPTKT
jgi:hypothetical protein